jgi:replication-associated recombination protein RarA
MFGKKLGYSMYELISALQKDIRRGNEYKALFWAAKIESTNRKASITKLWNRLKVIASEDIGPANPVMPLIIETLEKQYLNAREERRNDSYRLFLTDAITTLARSKKSRVNDDLLNIVYGRIQHEDLRLPMPDYALDMHTSRGKRMGRGLDYFFAEGCKLNNEAFDNPYTEKAKEILTKYGKLESIFHNKKRVDQQLSSWCTEETATA